MTLEPIHEDMLRFDLTLTIAEAKELRRCTTPVTARARDVLLGQARVADRLILLVDGIAASQQTWCDGKTSIARFFEPPDLCTNVSSAWTGEIASDDLLAITDLHGLSLSLSYFMQEYLGGGSFGTYLRHRMIEAHLFAKELVCAKTSGRTEIRHRFLETHHSGVLDRVPQKDIASFLGVTPQGLSRFLRHRQNGMRTSRGADGPRT